MSDTLDVTEVVTEETTQQQQASAPTVSETLQGAFWGETQQPIQQSQEQAKVETPAATTKETQEEILEPAEWLKKEFEVDSPDTLKQYLQEYKALKESKPSEEIKFANDESKKFFDHVKAGEIDKAHELYGKQKHLSKLLSGDITEQSAAEIIKFNLKEKYKEFSDTDVERKFNKQYGIPKEPVYDDTKETEEEYQVRLGEWKDKVGDIKADMLLDAKIIKPELEKLKAELVLPDIPVNNPAASKEPTQEELAAFKKQQGEFVEATEKFLNSFNGFSVNVKDKDVDYTVSYGTSKEEKENALTMMKEFAESGFNANGLFVKEWVNQDGSLNVNRIIEDKMFLQNRERIIQKVANDAANQRLELYLKEKKGIRIDNSGGADFGKGLEQKSQSEKLQEAFWGS